MTIPPELATRTRITLESLRETLKKLRAYQAAERKPIENAIAELEGRRLPKKSTRLWQYYKPWMLQKGNVGFTLEDIISALEESGLLHTLERPEAEVLKSINVLIRQKKLRADGDITDGAKIFVVTKGDRNGTSD